MIDSVSKYYNTGQILLETKHICEPKMNKCVAIKPIIGNLLIIIVFPAIFSNNILSYSSKYIYRHLRCLFYFRFCCFILHPVYDISNNFVLSEYKLCVTEILSEVLRVRKTPIAKL